MIFLLNEAAINQMKIRLVSEKEGEMTKLNELKTSKILPQKVDVWLSASGLWVGADYYFSG